MGVVKYNNNVYEVVLVFGEVKAVKLANIPEYTTETLKDRRY